MIRPLRRLHRGVWMVLVPVILIVVLLAILFREPIPRMDSVPVTNERIEDDAP